LAKEGQDPTKTLPDNYKVELDNDYARVVRVHYGAGAKLPDHTHPAGTTVYVYLNDSDGVSFRHSSGSQRSVTRPPVKAGAVRVSSASQEEHHTAENASKTPTDFLRIVLKTEAASRSMRRIPPTENEFSNKQLRITRLRVDPHGVLDIAAAEAALLVEWPSGRIRWIEAGQATKIENHDAGPMNFVRVDFLTRPK
jgi:hypothetical protein